MKIENLFNIENKIAVVTGGSRGIGEMITAGFLANGVKVYISARKAPALIDKAKELSDKYQNECIPIPCDLSSMEGIKDFVQNLLYPPSSLNHMELEYIHFDIYQTTLSLYQLEQELFWQKYILLLRLQENQQ